VISGVGSVGSDASAGSVGEGECPVASFEGGEQCGLGVGWVFVVVGEAEQWESTGASGVYDCRGRAKQLRAAKPSSGSRGTPAANGPQGGFPGGGGIDITKVQACFKQHGVKVENGGTPNFNDPKVREALQACLGGSAGAVPRGSGPPSNQLMAAAHRVAQETLLSGSLEVRGAG